MRAVLAWIVAGFLALSAVTVPARAETLTASPTLTLSIASWTPVLTFATPGDLAVTYTTQTATAVRIGRQCTLLVQIVTASFTHTTAAGALQITGSPCTPDVAGQSVVVGTMNYQGITDATRPHVVPWLAANVATIGFLGSGSGAAVNQTTTGQVPTGGSVILRISITFTTAS